MSIAFAMCGSKARIASTEIKKTSMAPDFPDKMMTLKKGVILCQTIVAFATFRRNGWST
jgi:hypothetical protein